MKETTLSIVFIFVCFFSHTQVTPEHISNDGIYSFLDELAADKHIEIYSVTKPYTRSFIYAKLLEALQQKEQLNKRQKQELQRYLDYFSFGNHPNKLPGYEWINLFKKNNRMSTSLNHIGFFYSDSLLNFSLRPVYGINYYSNSSGSILYNYGGAEGFASIGKHVSLFVSLRDNNLEDDIIGPTYLTEEPGGAFKDFRRTEGGIDYSETRGGLCIGNKWADISLVKDHLVWGDGYKGALIFSGRQPSYPMIKLHLNPARWIDFTYIHGWLVSGLVDSTRSYMNSNGRYRGVNRDKYIAANL
ncbi:MAG: hypothetical protein MI922_02295, partial [Bacteroidales bacterium]|nr:hypothetical protein [Bacteroidales bacterium]